MPAPDESVDPLDRLLTIPNVLTLLRLLCLPVFLWLLLGLDEPANAAIFLVVISSTDWFDGYIARHFNQKSNFGRLFDPTVDRVLFFVSVIAILSIGAVPVWFAVMVLVREVVVAGITVTLVALGYEPVEVTWWGKAGTFSLMVAFPLFLAGSDEALSVADACTALALLVGVPGVAVSYYAAFRYIPLWRATVRNGKVSAVTGLDPAVDG